jgi:hypothetical protein
MEQNKLESSVFMVRVADMLERRKYTQSWPREGQNTLIDNKDISHIILKYLKYSMRFVDPGGG